MCDCNELIEENLVDQCQNLVTAFSGSFEPSDDKPIESDQFRYFN